GTQYNISLVPQTNADTLRIGSRLYSFVASNPGANQIQIGSNFNNTLTSIVSKINNDSLSPVSSDLSLNLTAKTAGELGNSISLVASGNWATITPMSGGINAG